MIETLPPVVEASIAAAPRLGAGGLPERRRNVLRRVELGAGLALTLLVVYFHVVFATHAGGLWRDEVNTVEVARLPTFAQVWDNLQFDSFPVLIFPIVRGWTALFSAGDAALRTFGLLIGLGIGGALWLNARQFGHRVPLLTLLLLGCNPLFVRYGDSLRAYGLGILLMLLTFGAVWRVVEALRPGRVAVAAILALLSVQALYYNSVLLLSMCAAGALTAACERDWKKAAVVLGIGAPAALSLVPYFGTIERLHEWNFLVQCPLGFGLLWKTLANVTGSPDPVGIWLWTLLVLAAVCLLGWHLRESLFSARTRTTPLTKSERVLRFTGATLVIGTVCYTVFLKTLSYYTQPWYFIAYLALAAGALEAVFGAAFLGTPGDGAAWRWARLGLAWGFGAMVVMQTQADLCIRQTNLDYIARTVAAEAGRDDLVVNVRWECAIPFEHYYQGAAADMTLPPIADHRFHRYDLVLEGLRTKDAIQPVLDKVSQTLRAGHQIWFIGQPVIPREGESIPALPIRDRKSHPQQGYFYNVWNMQLSELLFQHVTAARRVMLPASSKPVSDFEDLGITVFKGWH